MSSNCALAYRMDYLKPVGLSCDHTSSITTAHRNFGHELGSH